MNQPNKQIYRTVSSWKKLCLNFHKLREAKTFLKRHKNIGRLENLTVFKKLRKKNTVLCQMKNNQLEIGIFVINKTD